MRLIDADELMEHAWRDKLDSRELIAEMIERAPTIKEIPTNIPIDVFEKLFSQPKTGHWIKLKVGYTCSKCTLATNEYGKGKYRYCPNCGAKMIEV